MSTRPLDISSLCRCYSNPNSQETLQSGIFLNRWLLIKLNKLTQTRKRIIFRLEFFKLIMNTQLPWGTCATPTHSATESSMKKFLVSLSMSVRTAWWRQRFMSRFSCLWKNLKKKVLLQSPETVVSYTITKKLFWTLARFQFSCPLWFNSQLSRQLYVKMSESLFLQLIARPSTKVFCRD